jgi:hypothetical protein
MDEWGLAIAVLALVATALGGVGGAAWQSATQQEKIRALEAFRTQAEADIKHVQASLARGDSRLTEITTRLDGLLESLSELKNDLREVLARPTRKKTPS